MRHGKSRHRFPLEGRDHARDPSLHRELSRINLTVPARIEPRRTSRQLFATALAILLLLVGVHVGFVEAGVISWTEDFADDPLLAERFAVPVGQDSSRFTYDPSNHLLTVHYDTFLPTAWYLRPLDAAGGHSFGRCSDFQFDVTFRICSTGYFADPFNIAQIGWGLINSQTTGEDRSGGSSGPFAFDVVAFDFFPNVSAFGGPSVGPTIIHSDDGAGFFANIDFAFGAETQIDTAFGDQTIALDTAYTARIVYDADTQTATLTIQQGSQFLAINAAGAGGPGGFDGDPATIQTILQIDGPFTVDTFALTAWQDTSNPFDSTVIADVDVMHVAFWGTVQTEGDVNNDGLVDGNDIAPFIGALLRPTQDACLISRGDFNLDGQLTVDDIPGFISALLGA